MILSKENHTDKCVNGWRSETGTFNFKLWLEHREFMREWLEARLERGRQGQIKVLGF